LIISFRDYGIII